MDELQISGKRYISSKRAAQQRGYHADYIGQLIRGGKVNGQKVGRAWYVEIASLDTYLGAAPTEQPIEKIAASTEESETTKKTLSVAAAEETMEEKETIISQEIEQIPSVVAESEIAEEKIFKEKSVFQDRENTIVPEDAAVSEEKETIIPIKKKGLTYLRDDTPLMPKLEQKNFSLVVSPVEESFISETQIAPKQTLWGTSVGLALFAIVSFGVSFSLASAVGSNLVLAGERMVTAVVFSFPDTFIE